MSAPDRYQMAAIGAMLQQWGAMCELIRNWNGYRTGHEEGGGGGQRIPIPDIPTLVVRLNQKILALPDENMNAITIWYAWQMNPGGGWWSPADKALALGLNEHTLRSRVRRGKELLLRESLRFDENVA